MLIISTDPVEVSSEMFVVMKVIFQLREQGL